MFIKRIRLHYETNFTLSYFKTLTEFMFYLSTDLVLSAHRRNSRTLAAVTTSNALCDIGRNITNRTGGKTKKNVENRGRMTNARQVKFE